MSVWVRLGFPPVTVMSAGRKIIIIIVLNLAAALLCLSECFVVQLGGARTARHRWTDWASRTKGCIRLLLLGDQVGDTRYILHIRVDMWTCGSVFFLCRTFDSKYLINKTQILINGGGLIISIAPVIDKCMTCLV